jgi:uncharacterized protein
MEFDGEFSVATSPEETWNFLLDPDDLGSCIPNCQNVEVIGENEYTATVGIEVSYISATFDTNVKIVEQENPDYLKVNISGDAKEGDSRMDATGEMDMSERDDGGTHLDYVVTMDVTGRIMNMGSRIVKSVSKRQVDKTINNIQDELGEPE